MLARSFFITGCNRGLGLEFVKQLVHNKNPPVAIISACRNPDKAEALHSLADQFPNIHIIKFDSKEENDHKEAAKMVKNILGDHGLNVLINNAGISTKFSRLNLVRLEQMKENLLVNAISPVMLTKALLPSLKKASLMVNGKNLSFNRAAVVNISSILGSIDGNDKGGFYPYRSSKAALNAIGRSMSIDLRADNILVTNVHPGWAKTDMGGPNAPVLKEDSVSFMLNTFSQLTEEHHGQFINYDGTKIPY